MNLKVLKNIIKTHFLVTDAILCILLILTIFFLNVKFKWNLFSLLLKAGTLKNAYSALFSSVVSIFVFLITSISILFAFLDNKRLEIFKNTKQPETMFKAFFYSIFWSGILSLLLLITFFAYKNELLFWIVLLAFSILLASIIRVIWIIKNLAYIILKS